MPVGPALRTYRAHAAPPSFYVVGLLDPMQISPGAARYAVTACCMVSIGDNARVLIEERLCISRKDLRTRFSFQSGGRC